MLKSYPDIHESTTTSCRCCYKTILLLTKLVYSGNAVISELFSMFGEHQRELLCVKYGVLHVCNISKFCVVVGSHALL